ncbi:MAG: DUF805 domain-containing protein [Hyphomonadaceae bacterium]|nr:DUF805 domain-containing protein [Hyphomonadaceae bacterium]
MGFWDYFKHSIANAGNGSGRASRSEYAVFFFVVVIAMFGPVFLGDALESRYEGVASKMGSAAGFAFGFCLVIPMYSLAARRFHDLGQSGWWALTNCWPLLIFAKGQTQANEHGDPPDAEAGAYNTIERQSLIASIRSGLNSLYWLS